MNNTETIRAYTAGEKSLEETNAVLKENGANYHLDPEKHMIYPDEVGRFGLLDTGTGTLDKVEVKDGHLVNCDCGEMVAFCTVDGKTYAVRGTELVES